MAIEGDIQALLSPLTDDRVWPVLSVQPATTPYLIYSVISDVPLVTLDGPNGTDNLRVQIDAYADSYGAAKALAKRVKDAMQGAAFINTPLSSRDLSEPEEKLYRVSMDFSVWAQ